MDRKKILNSSLKEIRGSFDKSVKNHFAVTWFARPLANILTIPFLRLGFSANQVTYLRTLIVAMAVASFAIPLSNYVIYLAVFSFYLSFVLDCVDGNLARLRDEASYWGKFVDGVSDYIFVIFAPVFVGVGIFFVFSDPYGLLIGATISLASIFCQLMRTRLSFFREWMVSECGPVDSHIAANAGQWQAYIKVTSAFFVNISKFAPIILLLGAPTGLWWYLIFLLFTQFIIDIVWIVLTCVEGRIVLNTYRKSRHSTL